MLRAPVEGQTFNCTVYEGSAEFERLAPTVWRALAARFPMDSSALLQSQQHEASEAPAFSQSPPPPPPPTAHCINEGADARYTEAAHSAIAAARASLVAPAGLHPQLYAYFCSPGTPSNGSNNFAVRAEAVWRVMPVLKFSSLRPASHSHHGAAWPPSPPLPVPAEDALASSSTRAGSNSTVAALWAAARAGTVTDWDAY